MMPMVEPSRAGLTTSGKWRQRSTRVAGDRRRGERPRRPGWAARGRSRSFLVVTLSMATPRPERRCRYRECRAVSSSPWTVPSSPKRPCRAMKATSTPRCRQLLRQVAAGVDGHAPGSRRRQGGEHRGAGAQRDLPFGREAAEKDADGLGFQFLTCHAVPTLQRAVVSCSASSAPTCQTLPAPRVMTISPGRTVGSRWRPPPSARRR